MFVEWGFLLTEIWVLLVLAALIGLFAGWLIWGGRRADADLDDYGRMRAAFGQGRTPIPAGARGTFDDVPVMQGGGYARPAEPAPQQQVTARTAPEDAVPFNPQPAPASTMDVGQKPAGLDGPRDGAGDDLTKIKGVGVKLQALCNRLGFFHFDQIAQWSEDEIAWVDDNLEGFKGRVTRDNWVAQAQDLAREG